MIVGKSQLRVNFVARNKENSVIRCLKPFQSKCEELHAVSFIREKTTWRSYKAMWANFFINVLPIKKPY